MSSMLLVVSPRAVLFENLTSSPTRSLIALERDLARRSPPSFLNAQ